METPALTADQGRDELGRPTAPLSWWRLLAVTAYWLAITVLWGAFTFSVIPRLVEEVLPGGARDPLSGLAIGVITTAGVLIAILVQPTMGAISDHTRTRLGRRKPYILAGTAAATLVGLLFVGLSLHLRIVIAASEVRSLARVTLANFGAVLFVTLFMVIREDQVAAGLQLIGAGAVSLVVTAPSLLAAARKQDQGFNMRRRDRARLILRFGLSGVSYLALMGAGILLLATLISASGLVLVVAIVTLLLISLRNTWDLLVTVGEVSLGSDKDEG